MRKAAVMCAVGCWLVPLCHAAESPPNEDFLEYLAEFDTGDDWTWFAAPEDISQGDEQRTAQPPAQQQERTKP